MGFLPAFNALAFSRCAVRIQLPSGQVIFHTGLVVRSGGTVTLCYFGRLVIEEEETNYVAQEFAVALFLVTRLDLPI